MAQLLAQIERGKSTTEKIFTDPVCKMLVTPETAAASYEYGGETYYFCAVSCRDRLAADPERYLSLTARNAKKASRSDIEYTCPMHPEVVQIGPGSCPKCGMALEPKVVSLDDRPDQIGRAHV